MKNASKLLVAATLAASGALTSPVAIAGPMGPSAKMAARLKKHPTSAWLAHYLPDDRYKIAGGVWKYVSTDLDTFYHRPDSALMMRQPAGRVIGFSSAQEAEEAGYIAGPGAQSGGALNFGAARSGSGSKRSAEMQQALGAIAELRTLGSQMRSDKSRNLPLIKQRLERVLALLEKLPVSPREARMASQFKDGIRNLISAVDLQSQGNSAAARQKLGVSLAMIQGAMLQSQQGRSSRRR